VREGARLLRIRGCTSRAHLSWNARKTVGFTEAFAPDFYLPDQDLYIELTVMKQSPSRARTAKLRKLREQYPEIKIKLFYKRDLERLAQHFRLDLAS